MRAEKNVEITLEHLREQQIDGNTQWKDLRAQRRRSELLAELLGWYNSKLCRVDHGAFMHGLATSIGISDDNRDVLRRARISTASTIFKPILDWLRR